MTTRNFDALFSPRSIVLVGASDQPGSVGNVLARNLLSGGFDGDIAFVNPHARRIAGHACFPNLSALTHAPDLAVIATPSASVYSLLCELGDRGCRASIIITAGDAHFRKSILEATRPHAMRIMGPNCLGFLSPVAGINASFAQLTPKKGHLALVTQSGAIATAMLDWAHGRDIGFSHVLTLGDMTEIDFGDALDYLALDPATSAILLYVEQITHARKFLSAARIASRAKPVIVVKAGRSAGGAKAAQSHTGALSGSDNVYDAAFRRAGMLRVETLRDLFHAAESLASGIRPVNDRLMILTNGGGLGVLAVDALEELGGRLAPLSQAAQDALSSVLPRTWSHANPIDILGDAHGDRYAKALDIIGTDNDADAILVMNCPTGVADNSESAQAVAALAPSLKTPLLACWMGTASLDKPRQIFARASIPLFEAPEDAVRAFAQLAEFSRNQRALLETPQPAEARPVDTIANARTLIAGVLADGRTLLNEAEAKSLLALYGVAVGATSVAKDPASAGRAAQTIGGLIAIKILSRDISHKSDVGGVALNLTPDQVESAAHAMLERVRNKAPTARLDGFTVGAMVTKPAAQELIVGASIDPTFGPVLLFGQGGVAVEVLQDTAIALPPLNSALARDLIARTRVARLLAGYRDRPTADLAAVSRALIAVSDMVTDHPEICELDINPLLADDSGAIALDARVVVRSRALGETQHLAITPYPSGLSRVVTLPDGLSFDIRPLKPADAPLLVEMGQQTEPQSIRLRFQGEVRLDETLGAARLSQLDYDREMALAAFEPNGAVAGIARVHFDPQIDTGEFSILIRSDLQRRGLGRLLLLELLNYSRARGATLVAGDAAPENIAMLALAQIMGAAIEQRQDGSSRLVFHLSQ